MRSLSGFAQCLGFLSCTVLVGTSASEPSFVTVSGLIVASPSHCWCFADYLSSDRLPLQGLQLLLLLLPHIEFVDQRLGSVVRLGLILAPAARYGVVP